LADYSHFINRRRGGSHPFPFSPAMDLDKTLEFLRALAALFHSALWHCHSFGWLLPD
jgi:hypothetical protein